MIARPLLPSSVVIEVAGMRYKADITAGALKLPESRLIADLLLRQVDSEGWKDAIVTKNVLQSRNLNTARRLTRLIRARLETMGPDLWELVRDGNGTIATHAAFAASVKHSPLLGDFLVPFELASIILLVVMIGAAYLAKRRRPEEHQATGEAQR